MPELFDATTDVIIQCSCGSELNKQVSVQGTDIIVRPCKKCLDEAWEDGYKEGLKMLNRKEVIPMEYDILCVFTPAGKTFTFRDISIVTDNETMLIFNYSAMSDSRRKKATFPKSTLVGWSVTPIGIDIDAAERKRK